MGAKYLRISFGVHDFFRFQDHKRKLLLPFLVLLCRRAVNLIHDPNKQTLVIVSTERCIYLYVYIYIQREREGGTWRSLGWESLWWVDACRCAKLASRTRKVLDQASASLIPYPPLKPTFPPFLSWAFPSCSLLLLLHQLSTTCWWCERGGIPLKATPFFSVVFLLSSITFPSVCEYLF